jgi:polysaccharide biosynthesis protein PslG
LTGAHPKLTGAHLKPTGAHLKLTGAHLKLTGAHPKLTAALGRPAYLHSAGMRRAVLLVSVLSIVVVLLAGAGGATGARSQAASAQPRVPQGFAGAVLDGPMFPVAPGVNLASELDTMVSAGVESTRITVNWGLVQPYRSWSGVPQSEQAEFTDVDGLPLKIADVDNIIALCADRRISVMLTVLNAPVWDTLPQQGFVVANTPQSYAPYAAFVRALVRRYGTRGSFWRSHSPRWPVRLWQIWNEPNLAPDWAIQPNFEQSYMSLVHQARIAIKGSDPSAKVVLAGMVNRSWRFIGAVYEIHGAHRLFDVVGVHPYTHAPGGIITILTRVRRAMNAAGDRHKPIVVDEFGWNSSIGKSPQSFGIETSEAGQAHNLATAVRLISQARAHLGLMGFDYNDWASAETVGASEWEFAGLSRYQDGRFTRKPGFGVFRKDALALERCRQKSKLATRCTKPG